jgi:hypothetical protein
MRGTWKRIGIRRMIGTALVVAAGTVLGNGVAASAHDRGAQKPAPERAASASVLQSDPTVSPPATTAHLTQPVVILYGDSLAWEAADAFVAAFAGRPGVQVITRTYGGTAICDWLDEMHDDAATLAPGAVVLEFSGNNLTHCMEDADGRGLTGDAYWARYRADAQAAIDTFAPHNTRVYLAGAPISHDQEARGDFHGGLVNAMYEQLASERVGVMYVDAGAAVLDHGRWTATLPCVPGEPCTGGTDRAGRAVNLVRAPDGGHFCPANEEAKRGVVDACPVWSSGAFRYGNAMARPVLAALSA